MRNDTSLQELTRDFIAAYGVEMPVHELPEDSYEALTEWLRALEGGTVRAEELLYGVQREETLLDWMNRRISAMLEQAVKEAKKEAEEVSSERLE